MKGLIQQLRACFVTMSVCILNMCHSQGDILEVISSVKNNEKMCKINHIACKGVNPRPPSGIGVTLNPKGGGQMRR